MVMHLLASLLGFDLE